MREFLSSIAKITAYFIAGFIIFFALIFSSIRLITPMLDAHREDIEKWATELLNVPVKIKKTRITWFQYQPELTLDQVKIFNKETNQPSLRIEHISVLFSLPKSIWHWQPVPSGIVIQGASVHAIQDNKGEIVIKGFPAGFSAEPYQSETNLKDMVARLYKQPRIILKNIDLRFTNSFNIERNVTLFNLRLENWSNHHRLLGKAVLRQEIPTETSLAIKWVGNDVDINKINARIYLYVSGLSLNQWFRNFRWQNWEIEKGLVSAKIWTDWRQGQFEKIQSNLVAYDVGLHSLTNNQIHQINRVSGNIGWKKDRQQITLAADDLLIDLPNRLWPVTSFYVVYAVNSQNIPQIKYFYAGYLNIQDVQPFIFSSQILPDNLRLTLSNLKLSGSLLNTQIDFSNDQFNLKTTHFKTQFNQLGFVEQANMPGVQNLNGKIEWDGNQGNILISSNHLIITDSKLFLTPILLDQLNSNINFSQNDQRNWFINLNGLQILNQNFKVTAKGIIQLPPNDSSFVNLKANFAMQNLHQISQYLPMKKFNLDFNKWLTNAFESGEVTNGQLILQGKLNDFPFDNKAGLFDAKMLLKNVNLQYAPDWPMMKHIQGGLTFTNRQMRLHVIDASILNVPLKNVNAEIADLGSNQPEVLTVSTPLITTDFASGIQILESSPLKKNIGKLFSNVKTSGPMTMSLGLNVPLKKPTDTTVAGNLSLDHVSLNLLPWNLVIDQVAGQIQFTQNSISATNIDAMFLDNPLQLNLSTLSKPNNQNVIRASIVTKINLGKIENWLKIPISSIAKGETYLSSIIDFGLNESINLQFHSNLQGITLTLPDELAKTANELRSFDAKIKIAGNEPIKLKLAYNQKLSIAATLKPKNEKYQLDNAKVLLGPGEATWPQQSGLFIEGIFDELTWDRIKNYLNSSNANTTSISNLKSIDLRAKVFSIFGQRFNQIHMSVVPKDKYYNVTLKSPDIYGHLEVPVAINPNTRINAQFEKINLQTVNDKKSSIEKIDIKSLPGISFSSSEVIYNHNRLGQIEFKTTPQANGLDIEHLSVVSDKVNLQAMGLWSNANLTRLKGYASSNNVTELLVSLGIDAHNFISHTGKINFDLNWTGAPYALTLETLNGNARIDIGKGRIVDIGQTGDATIGIGRMLSIFSLQSIPRRLTFDFSDIFQKGYSFDFIRGDFHFKNGNANTNNLKFDGPVARVDIDGKIGLNDKDYDLTLSITPYVTSTLPVAAAIFGGPIGVGAAVAAIAVNSLITPKLITYHYTVKGTWENPSFEADGDDSVSNNQKVD